MFDNLLTHIDSFRGSSDKIASAWMQKPLARERLIKHGIDPEFFAKHFGVRVVDYAIGVIEGKNAVGNCPAMHVLLEFFRSKNISLNDLYIVCSSLRNTLLIYTAEAKILNQDVVEELMTLMDLNFEGVMLDYIGTIERAKKIKQTKPKKGEMVEQKTQSEPHKISAKEFVKNSYIDRNDMDEIVDLEDMVLDFFDTDNMSDRQKAPFIKMLEKYGDVLNEFKEFADLAISLKILSSIIGATNLFSLSENKQGAMVGFCRSLAMDLREWRHAIFVDQNINDIFWLNDSLMSLMVQMQVLLAPDTVKSDSELELF